MFISSNVIAKKYATSFVNVYFSGLSEEYTVQITNLELFLKLNKQLYIYLRIPKISHEIKVKVLDKIAQKFNLEDGIRKLMHTLLESDRIEILDKVLYQIKIVYQKRTGEELFEVISSHFLSDGEKDKVLTFIRANSKFKVKSKFIIDKNLIVGLKIKSHNFLWERSIAKQLIDIKQFMLNQAGL